MNSNSHRPIKNSISKSLTKIISEDYNPADHEKASVALH